jgi:tetratricopeptide (TPR) repeat protein
VLLQEDQDQKVRRYAVILLLTAVVCVFYAVAFCADADDYLQEAGKLLDNADYDGALGLYLKAVRLDPYNYKGYFGLGLAYSGKGDFSKDIDYYQGRAVVFKDSPDVLYELATAYEVKGNFDEAIGCLKRLIEAYSSYYAAYRSLGDIYGKKAEYERELEFLKKAAKLRPSDKSIYFTPRIPYGKKACYEKAISCFQKSLKLNPDDYESYQALGTVYRKQLNYNKSRENMLKFRSRPT